MIIAYDSEAFRRHGRRARSGLELESRGNWALGPKRYIREACGHFRRPQKPVFERIEYPKSRSIVIVIVIVIVIITLCAQKDASPKGPAYANPAILVQVGQGADAPNSLLRRLLRSCARCSRPTTDLPSVLIKKRALQLLCPPSSSLPQKLSLRVS